MARGRPKKVKDETDEIQVEKPAQTTEKLRYCKECNGILFSGSIIHRKGCSKI